MHAQNPKLTINLQQIEQAHQLYCQLTNQNLILRIDRQRAWFELLRAGYELNQIKQVILYLQREIQNGKRNVGALKLSNILQLDRFEEDLAISHVRLKYQPKIKAKSDILGFKPIDPVEREKGKRKAIECLKKIKENLNHA